MKIERNEIIKYLTTVSLSSLANSASALAVYWYVLETTASVETLIMAGILQSLPTVFAFIIANIAKGKSSRFFMWVSDAIRAVLFIALFLTCDLKYAVWIVIVINIVLHVLEQLRTTATTTIIAELNEKQTKYGIWVGMSNGIKSIFELIGVASCGYFFEKIGYKFTFISIALFFILSTVVSFTIKENAEITEKTENEKIAKNYDISIFSEKWRKILNEIKKESVMLAALAVESYPAKVENGVLYIKFPNDQKFHSEQILLPEKKPKVEKIINTLCNTDVTIQTLLEDESSQNQEDKFLQKAINFFDGEILERK